MKRTADVERTTLETSIKISLNLDGSGKTQFDCAIGFFKHMLNSFANHGLFDITIQAKGDLDVDQHHLVEDTGIVLGSAFAKALGTKEGIRRTGSCLYPMDETLARAACDIAGRPFLFYDAQLSGVPLISADEDGNSAAFQTDTIADFWQAFCNAGGITMHLEILRGRSDHHKIEALFKAASRALRNAVEIDPRRQGVVPSTKGSLLNDGVYLC